MKLAGALDGGVARDCVEHATPRSASLELRRTGRSERRGHGVNKRARVRICKGTKLHFARRAIENALVRYIADQPSEWRRVFNCVSVRAGRRERLQRNRER